MKLPLRHARYAAVLGGLIAVPITVAILWLWKNWGVLVILRYSSFFVGGAAWLPSKGLVGNAISSGVIFGFILPLAIKLIQWRISLR